METLMLVMGGLGWFCIGVAVLVRVWEFGSPDEDD